MLETHEGLNPCDFDSDFEGGNLDMAAKTFQDRNDEYDLVLRLDSNCRSHQQWFYFKVITVGKGQGYKGKKVRFNILNFTKPHSLYQQGMKPVIWSEKLNQT
jgi:cytosolic carboxypeptidase protein 2/3